MKTVMFSKYNIHRHKYDGEIEIIISKIVAIENLIDNVTESFHSIIHCEGGVSFAVMPERELALHYINVEL